MPCAKEKMCNSSPQQLEIRKHSDRNLFIYSFMTSPFNCFQFLPFHPPKKTHGFNWWKNLHELWPPQSLDFKFAAPWQTNFCWFEVIHWRVDFLDVLTRSKRCQKLKMMRNCHLLCRFVCWFIPFFASAKWFLFDVFGMETWWNRWFRW